MNGCEGERLCTKGTKMNERHTFASAHPQSSSHIIIKHTTSVVPVLLGPQIPRREREETSERYSRAILTLFVPWRSVQDLCELHQTWSQALEVRKLSISENALKTIENIQILHECKNDRDEHLHQIIAEAQDNTKIDSILIPNYYEGDENNLEDDSEELLQMLSLVNETTTKAYSASLENIATELGLSNGTRGIFRELVYDEFVENFQYDETVFPKHTKFITQPKYALVEFSSCKLDSGLKDLKSKIVPIFVTEQTFLFDVKELLTEQISKAAKMARRPTKISIKRKALPLIPAYSITTHKSQGQTLGRIIVDLVTPPGPVEVASVYVPLSRVKRLDDLLIVRPFDFSSLQVKPSPAQLEELNRLDKIAQNTQEYFATLI
ncbi:unnamed protein product [Adineta steineri]|uniref:Uncharacterized protein n=2 Tax=Adineta steineri TaxID=433720 RepID=A0A813TZY3_9BILA|nr:unnamed protein product [Adineta steineri]